MRIPSYGAAALVVFSAACDTASVALSGAPTLQLDATPQFRASGGVWSGDSIFFHRTSAGQFTPDGGVVVTLRERGTVVFLDSDGVLVGAVGRRGRGPGEFQSLSRLYQHGSDRIATWDVVNRRVSVFRDRAVETEFSVTLAPQHVVIGFFGDGSIVSAPSEPDTLYRAEQSPRLEQPFLDSVNATVDLTERFYRGSATAESKRVILEQVGPVGGPVPSVWKQFLVDTAGRFWLQRATGCSPAAGDSSTWDLVDPNGGLLGTLSVPGNLRVLAIAADRVLAVETDGLGVEWVSVYQFTTAPR